MDRGSDHTLIRTWHVLTNKSRKNFTPKHIYKDKVYCNCYYLYCLTVVYMCPHTVLKIRAFLLQQILRQTCRSIKDASSSIQKAARILALRAHAVSAIHLSHSLHPNSNCFLCHASLGPICGVVTADLCPASPKALHFKVCQRVTCLDRFSFCDDH